MCLKGFDAYFFGRIDREDKARRLRAKEMEMVWETSNSQGATYNPSDHVILNAIFHCYNYR